MPRRADTRRPAERCSTGTSPRTTSRAFPTASAQPATACIVVHGTGRRMLLMGDSIARMWSPAFIAIAKHDSLTLAIASYPACPWQLLKRHGLDQSPRCPAHARYWYDRVVPGFDPDIIVLAERAFDAPGNVLSLPVNGRTFRVTTAPAERTLATASRTDLQLLHRAGRKIVILQPTPLAPDLDFNQLGCLSTGTDRLCLPVQSRSDRVGAPLHAPREQPRRVHPRSEPSRVPTSTGVRPSRQQHHRAPRSHAHHRDLRECAGRPDRRSLPRARHTAATEVTRLRRPRGTTHDLAIRPQRTDRAGHRDRATARSALTDDDADTLVAPGRTRRPQERRTHERSLAVPRLGSSGRARYSARRAGAPRRHRARRAADRRRATEPAECTSTPPPCRPGRWSP